MGNGSTVPFAFKAIEMPEYFLYAVDYITIP